ncbi:hypothetical protein IQ260_18330 [Leptolyngbya cf. ectocarpi LEGE 11479]|uniref:Uncharacterized protein n=1 Tax=Leptolyngbya cf. ectocarpi LEGE 11479 TaxID=1828722 RepID=A0A928ZW94_LEPEC|nr:hypothetical protein [Leptolyngbya ectocarpi]MBE9068607.1 hypothetical protein [Leptolyngbya cf. ectocarpi LEGE 11479]
MDAELDEIPVSSLPDRYGVHRSQVYARMDALKKRDRNLIPTKRGKKSYITRQMLDYLDGMAALIQQGQTTSEAADQVMNQLPTRRADSPVDMRQVQSSELAITNQESGFDPDFDFEKLLSKLRGLQELANQNWWLSSSQIANVLELKSLPPGDEFERYGFRFTKAGKNGPETAWKIEKL